MSRRIVTAILFVGALVIMVDTSLGCITTPTANLQPENEHTMVGAEVAFNGRDSYDPDGPIVKYEWDFDYDAEHPETFTCDYQECINCTPRTHDFDGIATHTYSQPGSYHAALRVTDNASPPNTDVDYCTIYVHPSVPHSFSTIQDALDSSSTVGGDPIWGEIWVAPGRYEENIVFDSVDDGLILCSSDPADPIVVAETVLWAADRQMPVVTFNSGITTDTKLFGLTISGANDDQGTEPGKGIYCDEGSPTVENCVIRDNYHGMCNIAGASPVVSNCVFYQNLRGGAIQSDGYWGTGTVVIRNCLFSHNTKYEYWYMWGAAILSYDYTIDVTNCTFYGNKAIGNDAIGGAVCCYVEQGNSSASFKNCVFWGNGYEPESPFDEGQEIYNYGSDEISIAYCDIQGGVVDGINIGRMYGDFDASAGGNLNQDPMFVDADEPMGPDGMFATLDDGLRLRPGLSTGGGSPCIDAGDPATTTQQAGTADLWGYDRFRDGDYGSGAVAIDMGACEMPSVWFVDNDASPGNEGKNWGDASRRLQQALDTWRNGDEIWVAEGTYCPTTRANPADDRSRTFEIPENCVLYGGFPNPGVSYDPTWVERDWVANETTLSGDISPEDAYHVVIGADGAVLDGFTITGGIADGTSPNDCGGGMYNYGCSPAITNCEFTGNYAATWGAAMANEYGSPTVEHCVFADNGQAGTSVTGNGGGVYNFASSPTLRRCVFSENTAELFGGAMVNKTASNPMLFNCVFRANEAGYGAGLGNQGLDSFPSIVNCTFTANSAGGNGGAMYNMACRPSVTNCILWDDSAAGSGPEVYNIGSCNPSFRHCDIEGCGGSSAWNSAIGNDGGENIDQPPLFVDAVNPAGTEDSVWMTGDDGLRLVSTSPCVDAADGDPAPETDIVAYRRCDVGTAGGGAGEPDYVDIGAYEVGPVVVVMCWIDESWIIEENQQGYYAWLDGLTRWWEDLVIGKPGPPATLGYRDLVKSEKLLAVRTGCLVPPHPTKGEPWTYYYQDERDVMPELDYYRPPQDISIELFDRYNEDPDPPVPLESFTSDFDRIRAGAAPDYVVLIVDTSNSMIRDNIETGYSEDAQENFIDWLATNHPTANVIRVDKSDPLVFFGNERWIDAINTEIQGLIDGL